MIRSQDMGNRLALRIGCWTCFAFAAAASLCGQQQVVAHVLDVKGEWHLQGAASRVQAGTALTTGALITAASNLPGDAITIVRDEDMSRQRIACDGTAANPCHNPISIGGAPSNAAAPQSQFSTMVHSALAVLLNKPPAIESHYALTLSRGRETVREIEAVVGLDPSHGILLPAPPADFPAGRYSASITHAGVASSASVQSLFLTSEGRWRPLPISSPGLYEVAIRNSDDEELVDALILVVQAEEYDAKQKKLETMKSRTAAWSGPGAEADEHLYLRAFLLSECGAC
jgi:hypothetical protein